MDFIFTNQQVGVIDQRPQEKSEIPKTCNQYLSSCVYLFDFAVQDCGKTLGLVFIRLKRWTWLFLAVRDWIFGYFDAFPGLPLSQSDPIPGISRTDVETHQDIFVCCYVDSGITLHSGLYFNLNSDLIVDLTTLYPPKPQVNILQNIIGCSSIHDCVVVVEELACFESNDLQTGLKNRIVKSIQDQWTRNEPRADVLLSI